MQVNKLFWWMYSCLKGLVNLLGVVSSREGNRKIDSHITLVICTVSAVCTAKQLFCRRRRGGRRERCLHGPALSLFACRRRWKELTAAFSAARFLFSPRRSQMKNDYNCDSASFVSCCQRSL